MKYTGSCHCQAIRIEVDLNIEKVLSCNCSMCVRRGHLLAFAKPEHMKVLTGESALADYQWGKKSIHFHFCKVCGTAPFGRGAGPDGPMCAINVRCLDNIDIKKFSVQEFDGKNLI